MTTFFNKSPKELFKSFLRSYYRTILAVTALVAIVIACEEEPSPIGAGILPSADTASLIITDTFSIRAYTMYDDSVRTNDSSYYFGKRYSPYFGTTTVELVTQLNLLQKWPGTGLHEVDSVKLLFSVTSYDGDTLHHNQVVQLFEISEFLTREAEYYSNKPVAVKKYFGAFYLDTLGTNRVAEVNLPVSFGEYLLRDTSMLFVDSKVPDFRDYFRGLYIRLIENPYSAFIKLNTSTSTSGIVIYYRNAALENKIFMFVLSDKAARYKRILHDFETAEPEKKIKHINDYVQDSLVYQQMVNGVYTRIEIPGLEALRRYLPASVNKARLIMPVHIDGTVFTDETVPQYIYLRYKNKNGAKVIVPDMRLGYNYFNGFYNEDTDNYALNLASFVQEYLEGRISEPVVEIFMPAGYDSDLILKANHAKKSMRLELVMSKFQ